MVADYVHSCVMSCAVNVNGGSLVLKDFNRDQIPLKSVYCNISKSQTVNNKAALTDESDALSHLSCYRFLPCLL